MKLRKSILAIDPGASGGFAWARTNGEVLVANMPEGMTSQGKLLREIFDANPDIVAVMENVGFHQQGNNASASAKFARHVGNLEALLYAFEMPTLAPPTPQVWQRVLGALPRGSDPKSKQARKKAIQEKMQRRHPGLKVTLKVADALGILMWAQEEKSVEFDWL